jgi:hypothetical protein
VFPSSWQPMRVGLTCDLTRSPLQPPGKHILWLFAAPCIITVLGVLGIASCNKYNVPPPAATGSNASLHALQLQQFITDRGDLYLPLSPGWVPGRLRDNTDEQWHKLRPFALPLILGMFVHSAVGRVISRIAGRNSEQATVVWHAASGFAFCVFLHGPRAIWAVGENLMRVIMHACIEPLHSLVGCRRCAAQLHHVRGGRQANAVQCG